MGAIFVSYRREDSRHAAGRLVDRVRQALPTQQLFMDVDNIDLGLDFVQVLGDKVAACDVMLVIIGPQWLTTRNAEGVRRLDDPLDFVRIEVEQALTRDVRVIPILVDGAQPLRPEQLPPPLKTLARRQATTISHERFGADVDRIVGSLQRLLQPGQAVPVTQPGFADATTMAAMTPQVAPADTPPAPRKSIFRWVPWLLMRLLIFVLMAIPFTGVLLLLIALVSSRFREGLRHRGWWRTGKFAAFLSLLGWGGLGVLLAFGIIR